MSKPLMKSLIDALLPKGSIWTPKVAGFFEGLLLGLSDAFEVVRSKLAELAYIRNAKRTTVLDELERDYGVSFNPDLTEAERRAALDSRINAIDNTGSAQEMQVALQRAGFPLFVYQNSPAVDPRNFETEYIMTADDDDAFADNENAVAGVTAQREVLYQYFLPTDPKLWPFVFFIGGDAEFALTGELISIDSVAIDDDRRLELREIILKYKPAFTWCVLIINYT